MSTPRSEVDRDLNRMSSPLITNFVWVGVCAAKDDRSEVTDELVADMSNPISVVAPPVALARAVEVEDGVSVRSL